MDRPRTKSSLMSPELFYTCTYGCESPAKFLIGKKERPCCSAVYNQCPGHRLKMSFASPDCNGVNNGFYKKTHSQKSKDQISKGLTGDKNPFYGRKWEGEQLEKLKASLKGKQAGAKNVNYGKPRPKAIKDKISKTRIESEVAKGRNNPNWRHGEIKQLRAERRLAARTPEYKAWQLAVLVRDNYTCQLCGTKENPIETDHIKPWAYFPEIRYSVSNGRALCRSCHRQTMKEVFKWRG